MSAIGISSWWPNSCQATNWWGSWSTEVALNLLRVLNDLSISDAVGLRAERVHVRVAEVDAQRVSAVLVDRSRDAVGGEVQRLVPGDLLPPARPGLRPTRLTGRRSRSGSSWMSASATPLGQMWPRESGSSGLPRMEVTFGPSGRSSMVSSRPQMASQRLHAVRTWRWGWVGSG